MQANYRKNIIDAIKSIDTDTLSDTIERDLTTEIKEKQRVYFWIRLYLKTESDITIGDDITIKWLPSGEELDAKFFSYGKKGFEKEGVEDIASYNPDDDKKILCLMIEENTVNYNDDIPFIRTLFKTGRYYEHQLLRRSDLHFINKRNGKQLDYIDCDF